MEIESVSVAASMQSRRNDNGNRQIVNLKYLLRINEDTSETNRQGKSLRVRYSIYLLQVCDLPETTVYQVH